MVSGFSPSFIADFRLCLLLTAACVVATLAVTPSLILMTAVRREVAQAMADLTRRRWAVTIGTIVNCALVFGGAVVLGLVAQRALAQAGGATLPGAPLFRALVTLQPLPMSGGALAALLSKTALAGLLAGSAVALIDRLVFWPALPRPMKRLATLTPLLDRLPGAVLYPAVSGETLLRFGLLSLIFWGLALASPDLTPTAPTPWLVWAAIAVTAVIGGLLPLPFFGLLTAQPPMTLGRVFFPRGLVVRAMVLNGVTGGLAGFLAWRFGLEAAIVAQAAAQLAIQCGRSLAPQD
jgi:hypothetical protein